MYNIHTYVRIYEGYEKLHSNKFMYMYVLSVCISLMNACTYSCICTCVHNQETRIQNTRTLTACTLTATESKAHSFGSGLIIRAKKNSDLRDHIKKTGSRKLGPDFHHGKVRVSETRSRSSSRQRQGRSLIYEEHACWNAHASAS
jgi:hypothetical protein